MSTYREIHEHGVTPADLPRHLAENGAWMVNGTADAYTGRPVWGWAECARADANGWAVVTMTDPADVVAFPQRDPLGRETRVTLSRSYATGETCPVCRQAVTDPRAKI